MRYDVRARISVLCDVPNFSVFDFGEKRCGVVSYFTWLDLFYFHLFHKVLL